MAGYFDNLKNAVLNKPAANTQTQAKPEADPNMPNQQQGGAPGGNPANQPQAQVNPANWYEDLYTNKQEDPEQAPQFSLDGTKLDAVANNQSFAGQITDEQKQKLASGDFSVLTDIVESATRKVYRTALEHGSTLTGKFVEARDGFSEKKFSGRVKGEQVNQELAGIPNYSNPAVKSHLNDIANRLSRQHPDASPKEIALEAQRLLMEIANGVNPENTPEAKARLKPGETDFMKWLGNEVDQS